MKILVRRTLRGGLAAVLALSVLASPALAAAEDEVDGHEWLQEHMQQIRGRTVTLSLVRHCHARPMSWSNRVETAVGWWIGENTVSENEAEYMKIIHEAAAFEAEAWAAVGRPLCRKIDQRMLDALDLQLTKE